MFDPHHEYDVAIVGGGPAGSSAAIRLAQAGLKVLLAEQKKFPREKLCGEFISPECLGHFRELGVLEAMTSAGGVDLGRTVFYARNGRSVIVPSKWFGTGTPALGLSRGRMDEVLLQRARHVGVDVIEEAHASPLIHSGGVIGVELKSAGGETLLINAPLTIDSTGRTRALARLIEKERGESKRRRADFVAFKTHLIDAAVPDGDCEIYAYRGGYGGASRVEGNRQNVCFIVSASIAKRFGGDADAIVQNVLFANVKAKASLGRASAIEPWLAVPIESYGRFSLSPAPGLITIGDAAAFIDPFTGSGMLLALESAKIAADVISAHRGSPDEIPAAYARRHAAVFDRRLTVCRLLRHAAFVPFLAETMIKVLALSDGMTERLTRATRPRPSKAVGDGGV